MKTWDQFYPFIAPEVMNCPLPVIDHQLKVTARDFCQRTSAWREWVDPVTCDGTTNTFDYDVTGGQELVKIKRALLNDRELEVKAGRGLPEDWQTGDSLEVIKHTLVHFDNSQYMLFPIPQAGDVIRSEVVFKPTLAATGVGDDIYNLFAEGVAMGVKARLMAIGRQPWTDLTLSAYNAQRYEQAVHAAANRDFAQAGPAGRRTKPDLGRRPRFPIYRELL